MILIRGSALSEQTSKKQDDTVLLSENGIKIYVPIDM